MNIKVSMAVLMSLAGTLCASAAYTVAEGPDGDAPVVLSKQDGSTSSYILTPANWSDGAEPHDDANYVIMSNHTHYVRAKQNTTFEGKSLQLGTTDYKLKNSWACGNLFLYARDTDLVTFANDGLLLVNGECRLRYAGDTQIAGKIRVLADATHPFRLVSQNTSADSLQGASHYKFLGPVSGPDTAVLSVVGTAKRDNLESFGVKIAGDWSQYLGAVVVTGEVNTVGKYHELGSIIPTELLVGEKVIGGTVTMHAGTTLASLSAGDAFSIGTLVLKTGAVLRLSGDVTVGTLIAEGGAKIIIETPLGGGVLPKVVVSESIRIEGGKLRILTNGTPGKDGINETVIRMPASSTVSTEDISYESENETEADYPGVLMTTEDASGKAISLLYYPFVTLKSSDSLDRTSEQSSALTNANQWTDDREPHDKAHYNLGGHNLRIYDTLPCSLENPATLEYVFPGESVTMDKNASITVIAKSAEFKKMIVSGAGTIYTCAYAQPGLHGPIDIKEGGVLTLAVGYNKTLTCDSVVSGGGELVLSGLSGGTTSSPAGGIRLTADNEAFTGSVRVTIPVGGTGVKHTPQFEEDKKKFATVYVRDKTNLGGSLAAFNAKALTVEQMCRVAVDADVDSVALDEPTRGVFVSGVGRFFVDAEKKMTLGSPLAVNGTMWKEGAGTLELASPAVTFGADATAVTPEADDGLFVAGSGDLAVSAIDAVNGLGVLFTNFTGRVVVSLDASQDDFMTYGIRNTKTSVPFFAASDAKIPFVVNVPATVKRGDTVPLLTVKDEAYEATVGLFRFSNAERPYRLTLAPRSNGDGTTTLMATTAKAQGMLISIR